MVEGQAKECDESELIEAIKVSHEVIKQQCSLQLELAKLAGKADIPKRTVVIPEIDPALKELVLQLYQIKYMRSLAILPTNKVGRSYG